MNNAGAVCKSYVIIADDIKSFLALLFADVDGAVEKRLVFFIFKVFSRERFEDFVCGLTVLCELAENRIEKVFCHVIGVAVRSLDLCIRIFRVHAECDV